MGYFVLWVCFLLLLLFDHLFALLLFCFLFWIFLYIFNMRFLLDVGLIKFFSKSVGCCFVLLAVSFLLQSFFNLMESHLLMLILEHKLLVFFMFRKCSLVPMCSRFLPAFSPIRLNIRGSVGKSLIHLD